MSVRLRFTGGLLALASGTVGLAVVTPSSAALPGGRVIQQGHATGGEASAVCAGSRTQSVHRDTNYRVAMR
jgi:hypothetical protein